MDVTGNGTEEQAQGTQQQTENRPQDAAAPVQAEQADTGTESQKKEEEKEPDVYIDEDGNLKISDEMLGLEPVSKENSAQEEPQKQETTDKPQLYKVKVNGEEVEVTLDELLSGYSRTADYTKKTTEVANERKAIESLKAEIGEQMRALDLQTRYGVPITPDLQRQISAQADNILRNQYGTDVDDMSTQYQDARAMLINQLTARHSDAIKAKQRITKTEQYLRSREPNFDKINDLAMQIASQMPAYQFERLRNAEAVGDPAPMLEVFDVARQRFYGAQAQPTVQPPQPASTTQTQTVPQQPVQTTQKKAPEPPRTESGARPGSIQQQQPSFDVNGFAHMSAAEQTKYLISRGLVD